jgi:hypothetical protein
MPPIQCARDLGRNLFLDAAGVLLICTATLAFCYFPRHEPAHRATMPAALAEERAAPDGVDPLQRTTT